MVSEIIVQLAEFARGRLTLRGKSKVVQERKIILPATFNKGNTLPETNISPEDRPLQKEFSFSNH